MLEPGDPDATLGEVRAARLGRSAEAGEHVEDLVTMMPRDVEVLVSAARVRLEGAQLESAGELVRRAQQLAPGRADLFSCRRRSAASWAISPVRLRPAGRAATGWHARGLARPGPTRGSRENAVRRKSPTRRRSTSCPLSWKPRWPWPI